jgi:signal transduction histidine kinase/DNA-binding LacI/PurR family transcriptional regulator
MAKKRRPTIAFFTDVMNYSIPKEIFKGVAEAGRDYDVDVLVLVSRKLSCNEPFGEQANILYKLITKENVDGIIFASNLIAEMVGINRAREFCLQYRPLPLASIGMPLKGIPSLVAEDNACLNSLVEHIILEHKKKKIAFIGGPEGYYLSNERFAICKQTLAAHNLSFDPALVVLTAFNHQGGEKAVQILMDERKKVPVKDFDAIVAGNDYAARGALMELRRRGVQVPAQVAITGFDDIYPSRCLSVPLTSIYMPFKEMGYKAVELIVEQLDDKSVPELTAVPARLSIRNSCGCNGNSLLQGEYEKKLPKDIHDTLVNSPRNFLDELNEAMVSFKISSDDLLVWDELMAALREHVPEEPPNLNAAPHSPDGFYRYIWQAIGRNIYAGFIKMRDAYIVRLIETNFSSSLHIPQTLHILETQLPLLGIKECYLVFYNKPPSFVFPQQLPETSRLMMAFSEGKKFDLPETGFTFPTAHIIPGEFTRHDYRKTMIAESLFYQDHQIGYVLFYEGVHDVDTYEFLRGLISNAVQGAILAEDLNEHAEKLAKANERIRLLNKKLNEENKKLERSNQELDQFANIASHDLKEPLRKVIFFGDRLKTSYKNILDEKATDYIDRMTMAASRMGNFIGDLLQYSKVKSEMKPFERVDLNEIIKEVIGDLEIRIRETGAEISIEHLPCIYADSLHIRQLFLNVIGNAIKYHRKNVPPAITITSKTTANEDNAYCEIRVNDNGIGFDNKYAEKIFDLFQRLHGKSEYEGTGIGLSICKKIVEHHGGFMSASGKEGEGAVFSITLPLSQKNQAHENEPAANE